MRVLEWNLNHRARARKIDDWIAEAIGAESPDVLVVTEYVQGRDHDKFTKRLLHRFASVLWSDPVEGQNQVLIAATEPMRIGNLKAPGIHPAVPSNALHVVLEESGIHCLGFRMPAFERSDLALKRKTWEWLLDAAQTLSGQPSIITGDFNTAMGDSSAYCGDCLESLVAAGWCHMRPEQGSSFVHAPSGSQRAIDHLFASSYLLPGTARYSWEFQKRFPGKAPTSVGIPDHAMLIGELSALPD